MLTVRQSLWTLSDGGTLSLRIVIVGFVVSDVTVTLIASVIGELITQTIGLFGSVVTTLGSGCGACC
jgi:hypothetical protein